MENMLEEREFIADCFKRLGCYELCSLAKKAMNNQISYYQNLLIAKAKLVNHSSVLESLQFAGMIY